MLADPGVFISTDGWVPPSAHAVLTAFTLRSSVSQKPASAGWYYSFLLNRINCFVWIRASSRSVFIFIMVLNHLCRNHCNRCQYTEYDLLHYLPPSTAKRTEPLWFCPQSACFSVLVQPCQIRQCLLSCWWAAVVFGVN